MRDRFGGLGLRQPIIHPNRNMTRELRHLTIGDERADGDEAAVARRESPLDSCLSSLASASLASSAEEMARSDSLSSSLSAPAVIRAEWKDGLAVLRCIVAVFAGCCCRWLSPPRMSL